MHVIEIRTYSFWMKSNLRISAGVTNSFVESGLNNLKVFALELPKSVSEEVSVNSFESVREERTL